MSGPILVDSDEAVICGCESLEDKTLFEKVCTVIWAIPCSFFVLLWKGIPLLVSCIYETMSSALLLIWEYMILPLLEVFCTVLRNVYIYILSPTWNYVLVPTANICFKIGVIMFEYGIFPFWQGLVLIVEFMIDSLQYIFDQFLLELVIRPLLRCLYEL